MSPVAPITCNYVSRTDRSFSWSQLGAITAHLNKMSAVVMQTTMIAIYMHDRNHFHLTCLLCWILLLCNKFLFRVCILSFLFILMDQSTEMTWFLPHKVWQVCRKNKIMLYYTMLLNRWAFSSMAVPIKSNECCFSRRNSG